MKKLLLVITVLSVFLVFSSSIIHAQAYIQLEFSDIDYDEAQYIKFTIDADINFDIVLYLKDNDNNTFRVRYQTENNEDTGDYKDDNDDDELAIFLDEDEYVTGNKETFNSFTHSNSLSLDEYINTQWKKREYNGGSAALEKIRIFGDEFKLYYIAIDDGDFSDPIWAIDVSDENWDDLSDFENDGHSLPDLGKYSTTITNIAFLDDCIYITKDFIPGVGYGYGYPLMGYGYLPGYYGPYNGFGYGYLGYGYLQGYQPSYHPYGYYPGPMGFGLANDVGGYPFRYQQSFNPYGYGYQQPYYPNGNNFAFSPLGYQQPYNFYADPWIWEGESPSGWQPPPPSPWYTPLYSPHDFSFEYLFRPYYGG